MLVTILILIIASILFVNGKIRSDLVAISGLVALVLFNIITVDEALSGFSNSIVIMMIALFVVGGGVFQTGLAKMISNKILLLAGKNETKLFLLIMLITSFIGAFVSNTGTVALMLPVVVSMATSAKLKPARFLMPLAFASSMGGMLTLIGTPPNIIINSILTEAGYKSLSFFSFTPVGIICVVVGVVSLLFLSKRLIINREKKEESKNKKSINELVNEYQLAENLYRIRITTGSSFTNQTLADLALPQKYEVNILEVRRVVSQKKVFKSIKQENIDANTVIQVDDMLYIMGSADQVERMVKENHLEILRSDFAENFDSEAHFSEIGIAEVLLMPNSSMINRKVMDSQFREKFNINILGIQRRGEYLLHNVKDLKMKNGDALLVQGSWENIARLKNEEADWIVIGEPLIEASKIPKTKKAPIAAGILFLMVISMMFNWIPPVISITSAALLMIFTGCLNNVEEAYKTINWQSVAVIAAMLPMSIALEKTGVSALVSDSLVSSLGQFGPLALLAGVYLCTSFLTFFISNTATAVLIAPIALHAAQNIGVSPYPFLFAVTVAASMCFASPFSTAPNMLVMQAGNYSFSDYLKVGIPTQFIIGLIMIFCLPLLFPF